MQALWTPCRLCHKTSHDITKLELSLCLKSSNIKVQCFVVLFIPVLAKKEVRDFDGAGKLMSSRATRPLILRPDTIAEQYK